MNARKGMAVSQAALLLWATLEQTSAFAFEPMGNALQALLKTTQVMKKTVPLKSKKDGIHYLESADLYYSKKGNKVATAAFVFHGIYKPNCTHTWAIGIHPASGKVTQIRVIEMSCQHAHPTKAASFLSQFRGKGPADAKKLDKQVSTIAKATGSSELMTDAVRESIVSWQKLKRQL